MNIYSKIQLIQTQIKDLVRKEENTSQGYSFFNELQVMQLLKPLLEKYKLVILISDDISQPFIHDTLEDGSGQHCIKYLKKIEIVDAENNKECEIDKLVFHFWACGSDSNLSKAKGSSDTYSIKYALSKLFLIPVRDDVDPDYNSSEDRNKKRMFKDMPLY